MGKWKDSGAKLRSFVDKIRRSVKAVLTDETHRRQLYAGCAAAVIAVIAIIVTAVFTAQPHAKEESVQSASAVSSSSEQKAAFVGNTDKVKGYTASGKRIEETESVNSTVSSSSSDSSDHIAGFDRNDWRLILVNKDHPLPDSWTVQPVSLDDGIYMNECFNGVIQQIDGRIYGDLTSMLHDCLDAGFQPVVCSGYRPHDKQITLFDDKIARVESEEGLPQDQAEKEAATVVAIPGTSEHELGLAVDLYCRTNLNLDESQENEPTQQWLMANCWKYGFVLRYPKDKTAVTGITYEPWHYRYVGKDAAKIMYSKNLCLEEFVAKI